MSHQILRLLVVRGIDWKGIGYLTSIASVFLLGAIAWPGSDDPRWHAVALVAGMAASICGMGFRYYAHLQQQAEVRRAEAEAREARDGGASSGGAAARH